MNRLSVGNIAVEAQRAVRLNSRDYGNRVIMLVDEIVKSGTLSHGGIKEMLRVREIFCDFFYNGNTLYIHSTLNYLMGFAFKERTET
jgi:hypothetical protein